MLTAANAEAWKDREAENKKLVAQLQGQLDEAFKSRDLVLTQISDTSATRDPVYKKKKRILKSAGSFFYFFFVRCRMFFLDPPCRAVLWNLSLSFY